MKNTSVSFVILLLMSAIVACNDGSSETNENLSPDSMPIVDPGIMDTSGVVTPPPTNDQNNALPDTIQ